MTAPLLAALATALAVVALWTALGAAEHGLLRLVAALGPNGVAARIVAPLRAGRDASRAERIRLLLVGGTGLLAAGWLLAGPVAGLVLAAAAPVVAQRALKIARSRRRERLAAAAPTVARAIADALAGGHSIRAALGEASRGGLTGAAAAELRAARTALLLGDRTEDVLERLRARAGHPAYDAIVAAVMLQRDAGGDLARLLRGLAQALEEQVRAEADARGLTAQARFTALVVALLPLGAALLAELGRPGYIASLLQRPLSGMLISLSGLLQLAAWISVRRISGLRR